MIEEISLLLRHLTITSQHISLGQAVYPLSAGEPTTTEHKIELLTKVLYKHFYCVRFNEKIDQRNIGASKEKDNPAITAAFMHSLTLANKSKSGFDNSWIIEQILPGNVLEVKKGYEKRRTYPGEYITDTLNFGIAPGSKVHIVRKKELIDTGSGFYYAFGDATETFDNIVRIYWNIIPQGAALLTEKITTDFNRYKIPFRFKCLNQPKYYERNDSAVLYLENRHFNAACFIINSFYPDMIPYIKPDIPLFAKRLKNGVGFAEDPGNAQSFGMDRCKKLSISILAATSKTTNQSDLFNILPAEMESVGLSLETPYLNYNSKYPYLFDILENSNATN